MYDCLIVGGGIAGLQAAIQLGRYQYKVLVIDNNYGRSTLCRSYHNVLGWPDGVSGEQLRSIGKEQAEKVKVEFKLGKIVKVTKSEQGFTLEGEDGDSYKGKRLLLATGILDRIPDIPNLKGCLGTSVYVCPDCDGYEVKDKRTIVLGAGDTGANMAVTLTHWTDKLVYINHEQEKLDKKLHEQLIANHIEYVEKPIKEVHVKDGKFKGVTLENGTKYKGEKAFVAFGGNKINGELANQLGVECLENNHVVVDPRTKMTNVLNVWAAGDLVAHSEQVSIAMGDGAQAAIWIHKSF